MTHAEWVAERAVGVPERLVRRAQQALATKSNVGNRSIVEALSHAAETLLGRMLEAKEGARDAALDLLAADACVTWAFEAAADSPETISASARDAMRRIKDLTERS